MMSHTHRERERERFRAALSASFGSSFSNFGSAETQKVPHTAPQMSVCVCVCVCVWGGYNIRFCVSVIKPRCAIAH